MADVFISDEDIRERLVDPCPNRKFVWAGDCDCGKCFRGKIPSNLGMELALIFGVYFKTQEGREGEGNRE